MTGKEENIMKKVAVVTGASRRIERAIAKRLAMDGFFVVVSYLGDAAEATALAAEIIAMGGDASAIEADVTDHLWVKTFFEEIVKAYGGIDVVVHNSHIIPLRHFSDDGTLVEVIDTNLHGTYLVLAQTARHIANGGRIILMSSRVKSIASADDELGATSEAGFETYLYELANELRERNISVNVIACEPCQTGCSLEDKAEEQVIHSGKRSSCERLERPADIAGIVSVLAGPDGHFVTSQVLCANCSPA
jgi:3-oxoacyl-[acyl-carrier protein] reductase